jgi:hypothetical protein
VEVSQAVSLLFDGGFIASQKQGIDFGGKLYTLTTICVLGLEKTAIFTEKVFVFLIIVRVHEICNQGACNVAHLVDEPEVSGGVNESGLVWRLRLIFQLA